jgi:hypothetical protein
LSLTSRPSLTFSSDACKWYLSKHWEWECLFCGHTPYAPSDPMDMVYKATLGQIEVASCEGRL